MISEDYVYLTISAKTRNYMEGEFTMGGMGSGNWKRHNSKPRVENCRTIDINLWQRVGIVGREESIVWAWLKNGVCVASIGVISTNEGVTLSYKVNGHAIIHRVVFTYTKNNFGSRLWFICPGHNCGRRVAKLYLSGEYFLCRHCQNLSYNSRNKRELYLLRRKADKIWRKFSVNGIGDLKQITKSRPKGMHAKTFKQLLQQARRIEFFYERKANSEVNKLVVGLQRRLCCGVAIADKPFLHYVP